MLFSGCGPSQGPFAEDRARNRHLVAPMPDSTGIVVRAVTGVPEAQAEAVREAMAEAFARLDVPAATDGGNRAIHSVEGAARTAPAGGKVRVSIAWRLYDRSGGLQGETSTAALLAPEAWDRPEAKALGPLVDAAAARFTAAIVEPAYGRTVVPHRQVTLHIWPIVGPSQQGNRLLRHAMARALARQDFAVVGGLEQAKLILSGDVSLGPAKDGQRPIEIVWAVLAPDGKELGRLNQRNTVPEETLRTGWTGLARSIANAAAGGVGELVRRLPEGALAKAP